MTDMECLGKKPRFHNTNTLVFVAENPGVWDGLLRAGRFGVHRTDRYSRIRSTHGGQTTHPWTERRGESGIFPS